MWVGALYKDLDRVRIWGHRPPGCASQKCGVGLRRWENQRRLSSFDTVIAFLMLTRDLTDKFCRFKLISTVFQACRLTSRQRTGEPSFTAVAEPAHRFGDKTPSSPTAFSFPCLLFLSSPLFPCHFAPANLALQALYMLRQSVRLPVRLSVRLSVRHTPVLCLSLIHI